jgi:hypothetical protein
MVPLRRLPSDRLLTVVGRLFLMDVQNICVAVWNARVLNNPARRSAVRIEVDDAQASVVCVSESKLQSVTQFDIAQSFGARFDGLRMCRLWVPLVACLLLGDPRMCASLPLVWTGSLSPSTL